MNRLHSLDYLRGLAACSIMIYHYVYHFYGDQPADTILGRLSIYGVSIFYILSGLTLYLVYRDRMKPTLKDVKEFGIKRIFRILPLLWLVTTIVLVLIGTKPDWLSVFLNYTGLFGFFDWTNYYAQGVWSIGNELVFYLFFPFFMLLINRKPVFFYASVAVLGAVYILFTFYILKPTNLGDQWGIYINPLNQVFLFSSGVLMGFVFHAKKVSGFQVGMILFTALVAFLFYPTSGETISLVTDWNRVAFTLSMFCICFSFYKLPQIGKIIPLAMLGEASYSIYLLHPIVLAVINIGLEKAGVIVQPVAVIAGSSMITIIGSYICYKRFELLFIDLGKKLFFQSVRKGERNAESREKVA